MTFDDFEILPLDDLRQAWDALPDSEKSAYADDYAMAVIESGRDAGDHPFHRILGRTRQPS